MTTILAPTTDTTQHTASILTPADVLDIQCALQNAAATDCTTLNTADRQALALLTYDRQTCKALPALLIERILDGTDALPVNERRAGLLLRLIDRLPAVTDDDVDAWLADRDIETPSTVDRIINTLAAYTATRTGDPGYPLQLLYGALQTVIRVGKPSIPLADIPVIAQAELATALAELDVDGLILPPQDDPVERAERIIAARAARHNDSTGDALRWALRVLVAEMAHRGPTPISDVEQYAAHEHADRLIEQAARQHMAAEYGEQAAAPTLPAWKHDVTRAELAHVPHSITVEPITDELRRDSDLPADATLVVVERHAGRLAKVCDTTDVHVAEYAEWGYNVTIEDVARGIAGTYGATYVETAAAVAL